ncbi:hypothetical protein EZV62_027629 [Acer yangbiense]|uniref:Protein FAR1-RELATED SEQUENCE n=1 Tax=Acer yangbiense TaxID=1000413 RepID=A0A5C7GUW4_9ROSI|nr:hypothetical protein EZV62_027629 [Acer yangbiense]
MGIDLEQPSGEYYKEDNRPNVNVNMVNGDDEGCNRGGVVVNSTNNSGNNKENTGPNVSGTAVDGRHKVYARDRLNLNSVKNIEPHEGMDFESKEEAFSFYKEYAKSVGFATIIKASRRSRISGKFIDAKFVCTRYGNKREPSTAETAEAVTNSDSMTSIPIKKKRGRINRSWSKTDCKASMHVKRRQEDGRWVIRSFIKEHNHEIFPDQAYYFRGHRNLDLGNSNVDALHAIRDRTKRMFVAMSRKSGGYKKLENQKGSLEKRWWKIVDRFNLRNDMWFQSLYEDRERWIPTFMKDIFLAGMSTTQRSESINSFFDKYIQRKTTLKEFLDQYKAILQEKCEEEAKADFETRHKQPGLKSPSPFGKQMAPLYTHAIFKKFQVEVLGVVACHPRKESEYGATKTYKVQDFEENQDFIVVWNEMTSDVSCLCHSFEFNGYLCRHVMIVLQMFGVHSIPSQYILTRWTKDAKSKQTGRNPSDVAKSRVQRYNDLCQRAFKLGDEGSLTQESYSIVLNALEEALRKCENVNNSIQSVMDSTSPSTQGPRDYEDVNQGNSTSKTNQNNSVPKKRQVHPETEVITIGMHDSWQQMGHSSLLRAAALDCSYETQERMQGMEQLNSRASTLDGYFGAQQIVQGMGQLNSMAPSRDDYYGNQHNMQGLGQLNSIAPMHDARYITQQRMHGMLHFRPSTVPNCFDIQDGLQDMDQSNVGPSQLHGIPTKHLHPKHLSR